MLTRMIRRVRQRLKKADPFFWLVLLSITLIWILRILLLPLPATNSFINIFFNLAVRVLFFLYPVLFWNMFRRHNINKDFALRAPKKQGVLLAVSYLLVMILFELVMGKSFVFTDDIYVWVNVPFAPIIEELLYRGVVMTYLLERGSSMRAILVSTGLFVFAHWPGWVIISQLSLSEFLFASFQVGYLSLALGYIRHKGDSIYPPIVLHIVNNLLAFARI